MDDHLLFLCQLIIRSHEGPDAREKRPSFGGMDEGYTVDHVVESGKLITLFSAPDYPQFQVYNESKCYISCCPVYIFHAFISICISSLFLLEDVFNILLLTFHEA